MDKRSFIKNLFLSLGFVAAKKVKAVSTMKVDFEDADMPPMTVSLSASSSPSRTPSITPTRTPSTTPSRTPSLSPSRTPSPTSTPSNSGTPSISVTPSNTPSISRTPTPTSSISPSTTPSSSSSSSPSVSSTPSLSITPSVSPTSSSSPSISITPSTSSSPSSSITPSITPSTTPSESGLLPVDLLYFDLHLQRNGSVLITYATTSEINNDRFEIQRKKLQDLNFEIINTQKAKGNISSGEKYFFEDNRIKNGEEYIYQLVQYDINLPGKVISTKTIHIQLNQISISDVYLNPITNKLQFSIDSIKSSILNYKIIDLNGKLILSGQENINSGIQVVSIEHNNLSNGIYLLEIDIIGSKFTKKFIIY